MERLFPGLANLGIGQNANSGQNPLANVLTQALPALKNAQSGGVLRENAQISPEQQSPTKINEIIQNLPSMIVAIPGLGNVDISKVEKHVLNMYFF